jgi:hypothetical protein
MSTVDRTLVVGSVQRVTRRGLLTTAGASIVGVLLAKDSLCATQRSSTTTTAPEDASASFWPYDVVSLRT